MQNQLGGRSRGATGSDRPMLPGSHLPQTMHLFFLFSFIIYVYDLSLQKKYAHNSSFTEKSYTYNSYNSSLEKIYT
jgi:hypothetical protein